VRLRALRIDRGLTQEGLAHLAGLSVATMPRLEGEKTPAHELTVRALAEVLGVERDELLKALALGPSK
jgi:transcriptional regulator with XRE-family HTH domain